MSNFDDYITGERGGIPWAQAAAFFVELKDVAVPEPVLTKEAMAGLLKLAHISKVAQTPEEAIGMTQQAAMTDPNVVAALDYQEMAAEREALQQTVQAMQQQVVQSQQAQQAAEQQVQQMSASNEALQAQVEQANMGRQAAVEQAVQAKDQALSEVVNQQQHRAQIMQTADQLAMQLKQVAATSPNEAMAQQQQAAAQQEAMAAQEQGGQPQSAKARKETQEAQQAGVDAQVQTAQAQQAQQEDAAKQEAAAQQQAAAAQGQAPGAAEATQQQQGAAGAPMPKQSADSVAEAALRMLVGRPGLTDGDIEKLAYFYLKGKGPTVKQVNYENQPARPEWNREIGRKKREHFENFIAMAEEKKGKPLTPAEADKVITTYNQVTGMKVPLTAEWRHGSIPWDYFEKTAAPLGIAGRLAYAAGGGAVGAGLAAGEQYRHGKKFGRGKASDAEIDRRADYLAASVKARRDPTYINKLRAATAKYKEDLERADRQHPGGAIARGAVKGALIGGLGGGAIHSLGGRARALLKSRAAQKAAEKAAKAAK